MSETKAAAPSPPRAAPTAQAARPRKESRGWLALILQVLGFAGAAAVGFAASHYYTLEQQAAAERQKQAAEAQSAAAAQPTPTAQPTIVEEEAEQTAGQETAGQPPADEPFDRAAADEAAAPEQRFSEDVERAEMVEAEKLNPALQRVPPGGITPSVDSTSRGSSELEYDQSEPKAEAQP